MTRQRIRALVIEDDSTVSRGIALILKSHGHDSDIATSGGDGLARARAKRYDIIVLDLTLPDMDGHRVLQSLRSAKIHTPVLILSGSSARDDKIKGLGVGADDYVTKPFDKDELMARIRAIVRRAKGPAPRLKPAALDSGLFARRGDSSTWTFAESYTPPQPAPAPAPTPGENRAAPVPEAEREPAPQLPAQIIVMANAKGGTGKSTIGMHLIVALLKAGRSVGSIDIDSPQGTLSRYLDNRRRHGHTSGTALPLPEHRVVSEEGEADFEATLARLAETCDTIVVDTPGHVSALTRAAMAHADVLVTPINDSFVDLDVLATVEADPPCIKGPSLFSNEIAAARRRKPGTAGEAIEWIVLRNRLSSLNARNKRRMSDVLDQLSRVVGFRQGPGLSERVIYRELFLSGLTLLDLPHAKAARKLTMSHVAARQELRRLLDTIRHGLEGCATASAPAERKMRTG